MVSKIWHQKLSDKRKNRFDFIKKKTFHIKWLHQESKKIPHRIGENIFKSYIGKELVPRIYKEHLQINNNKTTQFIMSKTREWLFLWRRYTNDQQVHKKIFNIFSHVEMQTKIMVGYHSTPTTMATIRKTIARVCKSNWRPHTPAVPVCAPLMHQAPPPFSFLSTLFSANLFFLFFFFKKSLAVF